MKKLLTIACVLIICLGHAYAYELPTYKPTHGSPYYGSVGSTYGGVHSAPAYQYQSVNGSMNSFSSGRSDAIQENTALDINGIAMGGPSVNPSRPPIRRAEGEGEGGEQGEGGSQNGQGTGIAPEPIGDYIPVLLLFSLIYFCNKKTRAYFTK